MRFARVAAILITLTAIVLGWTWMRSGHPSTSRVMAPPPHEALAPRSDTVHEPGVVADEPTRPQQEEPAHHEHEAVTSSPDPSGDLALYADHPMSAVPHQVVRGWGLGPRSRRPGYVGAMVVVDPSIDFESLRDLLRDIRAYHRDADALAVRVLNSMEAATYNRHSDGGALLAESVVATIHYNEELGVDDTRVGGEVVGESTDESETSGTAPEPQQPTDVADPPVDLPPEPDALDRDGSGIDESIVGA